MTDLSKGLYVGVIVFHYFDMILFSWQERMFSNCTDNKSYAIFSWKERSSYFETVTAQKMKFSMKGFFSKCDQIAVSWGFGHIYWKNP